MLMAGKKYNPLIHHRRSIRLPGYDYTQNGAYFITLCVKNRKCLFGKIMGGKMVLNDIGKMIENQWCELQHRFKNIEIDKFIIMPNHFHGIIIIKDDRRDESRIHPDIDPDDQSLLYSNNKRIDESRIHPDIDPGDQSFIYSNSQRIDEPHIHHQKGSLRNQNNTDNELLLNLKGEYKIRPNSQNQPKGTKKGSIGRIIQGFKSITTGKYINGVKRNGWEPFPGKLWQRNYFERIIRDENELNRIRTYILNNVGKWQDDENNPIE